MRFDAAGAFAQAPRTAAWVVLSRDDTFPDSLTGSALVGDGPLLLSATATLTPATRQEIDRVLAPGGRVYLLGGPSALSPAVEQELLGAGYTTRRLAGPSRIETAIAIAEEVRSLYGATPIYLARAFGVEGNPTSGWADSVSIGGVAAFAGIPILLTQSDAVHPALRSWLDADPPSQTVLVGGTAALSAAVEGAVPNPARVSGAERTATAAAISREIWAVDETLVPRGFVVINGVHPQGWAFGLAAAGLASDHHAPLLMVADDVSPATAELASSCGTPQVDLVLVGGGSIISPTVEQRLDDLDGSGC